MIFLAKTGKTLCKSKRALFEAFAPHGRYLEINYSVIIMIYNKIRKRNNNNNKGRERRT